MAARPTVGTIDASAVELICLAFHCACVMYKRIVIINHFDREGLNMYVSRASRGRKLNYPSRRNRFHVNFFLVLQDDD